MTSAHATPHKTSVKETLISIIIAFAMAFVFRGFVIEAFLIPTGSMAPTLMGAHLRFTGPQTGYSWTTDTRDKVPGTVEPLPVQGAGGKPLSVRDPMSRTTVERRDMPVSWGDRIFVMKYLYSIYDPQRWDVVVFKNPNDPTVNYIKRLLGLPNEQVALIDGDVFVRTTSSGDAGAENPWALGGWSIARKPERAQRTMWQPVFDSAYTPLTELKTGTRAFANPWRGVGQGDTGRAWRIEGRKAYEFTGSGPTTLEWNTDARSIDDTYAYNEFIQPPRFNVSDIRLSLGVRPATDGLTLAPTITTRGHEFRAFIQGASASLDMRPVGAEAWTTLATGSLPAPLRAGVVTNLDFWHADQQLCLYAEGNLIASGVYDWTPGQRVQHTFEMSLEGVADLDSLAAAGTPVPKARWDFTGGAFTLHRVALARDIYYQPGKYHPDNERGRPHSKAGLPSRATHPRNTPALSPDQFFVCGDNSPASLDARLWDQPNPWVAEIDPTMGVVNRDLLIGKAFWVYFPAPYKRQGIPVPDFGEMRFIW